MAQKRALIVDDSRSARVILGRMLEAHGLQVDAAESGEQAVDYLRTARPDVIFMDHLMPGMDGFEAVKIIKSDVRTTAIPIMMYTSQEGDDYVRAARALGAAGVLSKTLQPLDVSRALYHLHLLPDRREMPTRRTHEDTRPAAPPPRAETAASPATPMRELAAASPELKKFIEVSLEQAARRISGEIRSSLQVAPTLPNTQASRPRVPRGLIAALIIFSFVPTLVVGLLMWRMFETGKSSLDQANAHLAIVVAEQQTQIEALRTELRKRDTDAQPATPSTTASMETLPIAYGEPPLAGARVEHLRRLFDRLRTEGFKGRVRVEYFTGDFCLVGTAGAGYAVASADLPQRRCDVIGSPYDDNLTLAQRQTNEYTALVNSVSQATRGAIQVTTANGGRKLSVAYPPQSDGLTAGEWNRVAERNHRVEITLQPG